MAKKRNKKEARAQTTSRRDKKAEKGPFSFNDWPTWASVGVFIAIPLVLFGSFVFSNLMLLGTDTIALGYFARAFYAEVVNNLGIFPDWNPLLFGGLPFIEAMHGDIFYPTTLLLFVMDVHRALGWKLILHIMLAGVLTYTWLRYMGLSRFSSFAGGVFYMLGSHLVSLVYAGHDGKLFVASLTPGLFWLTERAVRNRRIWDFAAVSLGVAALLYTAHMQLAYFSVWGFGLYFLFRFIQLSKAELKKKKGALARVFFLYVAAGIVGVAAASVQLLPPFEYLNEHSRRTATTTEASAETGYQYSTSWSLHLEEAFSLIVPEFVGTNVQTEAARDETNTYWGRNPFKLNLEYAGLIPLLLMGLLFALGPKPKHWFFAGLALFALLYGLGATTPLFHIFYALIPGVKLFRAPSTIMFLFGFSIVTLGAMGLDAFWQAMRDEHNKDVLKKVSRYMLVASVFFAVLALLESAGNAFTGLWTSIIYPTMDATKAGALQNNLEHIKNGLWIALFFTLAVWGTLEAMKRKILPLIAGGMIILSLGVVDLWRVDNNFIMSVPPSQFFSADDISMELNRLQDSEPPFRVFDARPGSSNALALQGIEQVAGHHGNELGSYSELIGGEAAQNVQRSELGILDLMNARYVVLPQRVQYPGLNLVYEGYQAYIYENAGALPRAFFPRKIVSYSSEENMINQLTAPGFSYRDLAFVSPEVASQLSFLGEEMSGSVEWVEKGINEWELNVAVDRPALLVISNNYFPGWHAEIGGRVFPVYRVNSTFQGVEVPAGEHRVRFYYHSDTVQASAYVSVALLLLLLSLVGFGMYGEWKRREKNK